VSGAAGFTLIEFLVAMTVFAIGVLGIAMTFMNGTRHIGASGDETRAVEIAQQGLEDLLAVPFDDPQIDAGLHADPENPIQEAYFRTWSVEDAVPFAGCKRITVAVNWPAEGQGNVVTLAAVTAQAGR
jgi:type IV pilus assembly protein PilV